MTCSLCGKTEWEVAMMITGPDVYICNECVDLCVALVDATLGPQDAGATRVRACDADFRSEEEK